LHTTRVILCYLHGDMAGAAAAAESAEPLVPSTAGQYFPTELAFFACLVAASVVADGPEAERRRDELLARNLAWLTLWATSCPENYRHKQWLVEAEVARLAGRHDEATDGYERAISGARAEGFVRDEAIACERAALFHLEKGRPRISRVYMSDAHACHVRWGATVKAAALAEQYADLLPDIGALAPITSAGAFTLTTRMGSSGLVDAAALVRAAQALVGEVALEVVLERLVRLVVESAGAQRGVLLLAHDEQLEVAARLDGDEVVVGEPVPLEQATDIAASVVRYVARTREAVVLDDATRDHRFAADPHLGEHRPRSILCLALTQNDRLTGVLYLENNAVSRAFTRARVDLAGLLASLAATAVANAQLYARVEEVTLALRGANESLEDEVARRTDELRASNARLTVELAERARAEQARSTLHAQVVRMQQDRLAELSAPILPITDRVVVMPLIGTMDAQRGRQVMEAALMGAREHRAEIVIFDVTGMKMVDAEVADMLAATAGALKLLGARALVTGLSPEVAWTFIERGEQLGAMKTVATLRAAVALAGTTRRRPG
jgi:GAF domain-containing protein